MSSDAEIEGLIEALQQNGPSEHDAARVRARLAAAGIVTASVLGHATATASAPVAKAAGSVAVNLSARWASLSLLPKLGVVAAVSAAAVGGPIYGAGLVERAAAPLAQQVTPVARVLAPARATARTEPATTEPRAAEPGATGREATTMVAAEPPAQLPARRVAAPGAMQTGTATATPRGSKASAAIADPANGRGEAIATAPAAAADGVGTARFEAEEGTSAPPPAAQASTLAEETALLDAAFAALRAGDDATASALVAEHARRFPHGLLWRERERARTQLESVGPAGPR